jgi:ribosome-associated toxin RatA of RatAB toxin-antitoxin module
VQLLRSVLVDQSAAQVFDVIEAAEFYPHFLPWCAGAQIVQRDEQQVSANLHVRWHGVEFKLRTRNPKRRPEFMAIHLEQGPFRHFYGEWRLLPLMPDACKVVFSLDYSFDHGVMTQLSGPLLGQVTSRLMDAFVQRARSLAAAPGAG